MDFSASAIKLDQETQDEIDTEYDFLSEETSPASTREIVPAWVARLCYVTLILTLILAPLCFGTIHPGVIAFFEIVIFGVAACLCFTSSKALIQIFSKRKNGEQQVFELKSALTWIIPVSFLWIPLLSAIRAVFYSSGSSEHPVSGIVIGNIDNEALLQSFSVWGMFIFLYVITTLFLNLSRRSAYKLLKLLKYSAVVVTLTALSHWFYDNGKLFWTFEPNYVFTSLRARWPFVNANHLGNFLLPLFFVLIARFFYQIQQLSALGKSLVDSRRRAPSALAANQAFLNRALAAVTLLAILSCVVATIGACLSRGTWIGMTVGLILFTGLSFLLPNKIDPHGLKLAAVNKNKSYPRRRPYKKRGDIISKNTPIPIQGIILLFLGVLAGFYFFVNAQAGDVIARRIDYGLVASKDDIRWQMYNDSVPLFKEYLFFGTGPGGWRQIYPEYMSEELSGINPVYLHSDPFQFLIENGLLGTIPIVLAMSLLFVAAVRFLRSAQTTQWKHLTVCGLVSGLSAAFIGSLFDFPYRMLSINFLAAVILALTAFYIRGGLNGKRRNHSQE